MKGCCLERRGRRCCVELCYVKVENVWKTVLRGRPDRVLEERGQIRFFSNNGDEELYILESATCVSGMLSVCHLKVCRSQFLKERGKVRAVSEACGFPLTWWRWEEGEREGEG